MIHGEDIAGSSAVIQRRTSVGILSWATKPAIASDRVGLYAGHLLPAGLHFVLPRFFWPGRAIGAGRSVGFRRVPAQKEVAIRRQTVAIPLAGDPPSSAAGGIKNSTS